MLKAVGRAWRLAGSPVPRGTLPGCGRRTAGNAYLHRHGPREGQTSPLASLSLLRLAYWRRIASKAGKDGADKKGGGRRREQEPPSPPPPTADESEIEAMLLAGDEMEEAVQMAEAEREARREAEAEAAAAEAARRRAASEAAITPAERVFGEEHAHDFSPEQVRALLEQMEQRILGVDPHAQQRPAVPPVVPAVPIRTTLLPLLDRATTVTTHRVYMTGRQYGSHPMERKATMRVDMARVQADQLLSVPARHALQAMAGVRYHRDTQQLILNCDKYETRAENIRTLLRQLDALVVQAHRAVGEPVPDTLLQPFWDERAQQQLEQLQPGLAEVMHRERQRWQALRQVMPENVHGGR